MQINKDWVDQQIKKLIHTLGLFETGEPFLFEPTAKYYACLASGENAELQEAFNLLGQHPAVRTFAHPTLPRACYLSPGKGSPGIAGLIRFQKRETTEIQIPFPFIGEACLLGAILAHEISHFFLLNQGIALPTAFENERFTDLGAVFLGFGKLLLNGKAGELGEGTGLLVELGYLSFDLILYAYRAVNVQRNIDASVANRNLSPEVIKLLRTII